MEQIKSERIAKRAMIFLFLFFVVTVVLFSRFIYIQAEKEVQGENLAELLEKRWSQTKILEGKRGSIFDRNGEILAEEIPSYTIYAVLDDRFEKHVEDPKMTAQMLSTVLDVAPSELERQLSRQAVQVELGSQAKNMSYEKKTEIEKLGLEGIFLREDPRRYYPKQTFASHIIGYTERDMSVARMGLESSLNDNLQESNGKITYQKDGLNRRLTDAKEAIQEPKDGDDVYLTIDSRIQMAIEQTMNQVDEEYDPEKMIAIVANAKTGEILGISNRPSFNPNQYEMIENYTNYAISSRFEPGSTMKMFTLAAAIEEGVYQGEETYQSGSYRVIDRVIRDHNQGRGWGEISFNEGIQRSSNVALSKIAVENLGAEHLFNYVEAFGFRDPTGIDLPNEATGLIADKYPIDVATTSFGQGTAVTPIQQVKAATAIANEGVMLQPYIISKMINSNTGEVILSNEMNIAGEPISAETARRVLDLLVSTVTSEVGTGRSFAIDGFEIAGKTGTAQISKDTGGYLTGEGNHIYSFLGMAPASDPEVIVYVAVDRPKMDENQSGSEPVSMIFRQVMEQSLQYLSISPSQKNDTTSLQKTIKIEDYTNRQTEKVRFSLQGKGLDVVIIGDGDTIIRQSHLPDTEVVSGEKIIFLTNDDDPKVPNISNWSIRNIYMLEHVTGIQMTIEGVGFVQHQNPNPGTSMEGLNRMIIELSMKNSTLAINREVAEEVDDKLDSDESEEENDEEFLMD